MKTLKTLVLIFFLVGSCWSSEFAGRIIRKTGTVEILTHPSKERAEGPGPFVKYLDRFYTVNPVKLGQQVFNGNIVRTGGKDSKARIVFQNGDQFNIGSGTTYEIHFEKDDKSKNPQSVVNLIYGKIRAVVSKNGPRNNLKIKTRSASMGVRGTDFFVEHKGSSKDTAVSVIRGAVAIKLDRAKNAAEIPVIKGQTAQIPASQTINKAIEEFEQAKNVTAQKSVGIKSVGVEVGNVKVDEIVQDIVSITQTQKQELAKIQDISNISLTQTEKQQIKEELTEEIKKEVAVLEKKAIETTLEDVKQDDPQLHAQLVSNNVKTIHDINSSVVKKALIKAPASLDKATEKELNSSTDGLYDKYFRIEE